MTSWIDTENSSGFSLHILPYGIFSTDNLGSRIGLAVGDYILDMKVLTQERIFAAIEFNSSTLEAATLNAYAAEGKSVHQQVRNIIQKLLVRDTSLGLELRDYPERRERALVKMSEATMHLPMSIGDYTDFFVGQYHAQNCSEIFRPGSGLPPNYLSLPVGYHGRASSIVVSETPIWRPKGQFLMDKTPTFGPCQKLDFEVELAAFISRGNHMGNSIHVDDAEDHIFGLVLMNDWSARDIQVWEATPLGPFNGKNFGTTISPWIVPLDALEPFREKPMNLEPPLPYLDQKLESSVYNIPISISLEEESGKYDMFECNTKNIVFSFAQMLAHHTAGGCPMRTGDLIATGTLSGSSHRELGSLLEASRNGILPYEMETTGPEKQKISRLFLEDGDIVEFKALGFGTCRGKIMPSK